MKLLNSAIFRGAAGTLALLLLLIASGAELLHNHDADFYEHYDCPAHQLQAILSTALFVSIVFVIYFRHTNFFPDIDYTLAVSIIPQSQKTRAPPIFEF
ncbi:MAG: hypothetical protein ONA69_05335 [candidate division KSB1 bacterium]|nr:hypothetical protein [candidate division KSB1 bacterium]MDZ7346202.1 hypothetical protein [candidate division KSB1 bacterium]